MSTEPTGGLLANLSSLWCARTARTGPRRDLERADRLLLSLDAERSDGAASSSLVSPKTKRVLLEHSWRFSGNHGQPSGSPSKWSLASKRWRRASDVSEQSATAQPSTRRGCPLWPQQLLLTLPVLGLVVYISGSLACGATCSGIFALSPDSESTVFAELRRPVPLAQTHNYWYVVAFGTTMPLCMLFVWALLIVRIERIDRVDLEDLAALTRATNRGDLRRVAPRRPLRGVRGARQRGARARRLCRLQRRLALRGRRPPRRGHRGAVVGRWERRRERRRQWR
tara:strand:- start:21 stop:869 length:849 start_codon:yes stop_codon:yes gene_type:complete